MIELSCVCERCATCRQRRYNLECQAKRSEGKNLKLPAKKLDRTGWKAAARFAELDVLIEAENAARAPIAETVATGD